MSADRRWRAVGRPYQGAMAGMIAAAYFCHPRCIALPC